MGIILIILICALVAWVVVKIPIREEYFMRSYKLTKVGEDTFVTFSLFGIKKYHYLISNTELMHQNDRAYLIDRNGNAIDISTLQYDRERGAYASADFTLTRCPRNHGVLFGLLLHIERTKEYAYKNNTVTREKFEAFDAYRGNKNV